MLHMRDKQAGEITGIYQATSRGFGFVTPEDGKSREDDWFIPPRSDGGAWHGDQVRIQPLEEEGEGRRRSARVSAVTGRANKTVTGILSRHNRELWLQPDNDKLPGPIQVLTKRRNVRAGDRAAVAMTSFGSAKLPPMGTLREVFGPAGERESAVAAILYQNDISRDFPDAVLAEAMAAPQAVEEAAKAGRLDLRDKTIITIDGASSKDLDDAVSLEKDGRGRWVLGVHIADVSHYVTQGSALDLEAWERGTSVYFADQVVPMLPKELSNGICSLNPRADRLALSCIMTLTPEGEVVEHTIAKSVIRTTERMTYEDCNVLLSHGDPALAERYQDILPMLEDMAALSKVLEGRRRRRGALELDTKESYVICDDTGAPVDVAVHSQGVSEALIESFMLAANECVAEHLNKLDKPCVYRVHEKPSPDKAEALRTMVAPLGYDLKEADGPSLQKLLDASRGKPEEAAVSMMVLRALMKARYDGENLGHFGLGAKYYCHFTSPIRRYPDLMVHRILTALLDGKLTGQREKKLAAAVQKAAVQSSQREIAAQTAEREIEKRYMAEFMHGHLGETFAGVVSGVTRFGLFVMLPSGVEGLLPVEALPGQGWQYDESRLTLVSEGGGASYTFGAPLEVVCAAADPTTGQIDFTLPGVDPLPRAARREKREEAPRPPRREKHRGNRRAMHVPKGRKGRKKR
ncbi:ribonuclease R [Flavonifractor sp. An10]|uniref:ribonuclease R n=1 Tax=Flavonifractor sp. An10 TaxID=1965537 RepID=UPI0021019505|nr:ribonuclease R [Flavonifractor sp. An10]